MNIIYEIYIYYISSKELFNKFTIYSDDASMRIEILQSLWKLAELFQYEEFKYEIKKPGEYFWYTIMNII